MKRISIFFLAAAFFVAASFSSSSAAPDGQLDQILAEMQKSGRAIKAVFANMTQEKKNTEIGGKPERYSGQLFFKRVGPGKDKALIKYKVPNGQVVSVSGDEIILYQPQLNQAFITSRRKQASKNKELSFIATPYSSIPELKSQYDISLKSDSASTAVLELRPKAKSSVKLLTMWVDKSIWLPTKYVVEDQTSISTFTLSDLKTNGSMADSIFNIRSTLPKGTKVSNQ